MYYEYWGFKKPPFDNVPDPSMYVDTLASLDSAISETLFAIREGNECIVVIYGDEGVGKTLSLRKIIDLLDPDKYRIAFLSNPGVPFLQFLREIITQLTGEPCDLEKEADIISSLPNLILKNQDEGRKVLIFLDEANAISPLNMESLLLLTDIQKHESNPFTLVLAGTDELARRLEHPKRGNLFQNIAVCCRLEKIQTRAEAQIYIKTRLNLAGATREIFTQGAYDALWRHSENGVPRIINKLAKLCLKAGEAEDLLCINGELVDRVAARFAQTGEPLFPQRRPRAHHEAVFAESRENEQPASGPEPETAIVFYDDGKMHPEEEGKMEVARDGQEIMIEFDGCPILVDLTPLQLKEARISGKDVRLKIAGAAAARVMKTIPALGNSPKSDPISVWSILRDKIFAKIESELKNIPGDC